MQTFVEKVERLQDAANPGRVRLIQHLGLSESALRQEVFLVSLRLLKGAEDFNGIERARKRLQEELPHTLFTREALCRWLTPDRFSLVNSVLEQNPGISLQKALETAASEEADHLFRHIVDEIHYLKDVPAPTPMGYTAGQEADAGATATP